MGQYFKPILLEENKRTVKAWMYSHDYSNGLKLMEHSWLGNDFVSVFEALIYQNPQRVCWGGDYAENCKGRKTSLYNRCKDILKLQPETKLKKTQSRYVINHDKKVFVDKNKIPKITAKWVGFSDYRIHPLPLLTAEGNGEGGGDFFGEDTNNLVGSWSRDTISIDSIKPKGFTELLFNLIEE